FPNQSVNVRLRLGSDEVIAIPDAAVQFGSQGNYVYVIGEDDTASVRQVQLGAAHGDRVAVAEGLEAGERVVLEGLDRLQEGSKVEVVTTDEPRATEDDAAAGEGATPAAQQ